MKGAVAEKATLYAEGGDVKLYRVEIRLPDGTKTTVAAKGKDMQSALRTVLRTNQYRKLEKLPMALWIAGYLLTASASAIIAMEYNSPMVFVGGLLAFTLTLKVVSDSYFRYVGE